MIDLYAVDEAVGGSFFLPVRLANHRFGLARSGSAEVEHKDGLWVVTADLLTRDGQLVQARMWETFTAEREADDYRNRINQAATECVVGSTDNGEQRKLPKFPAESSSP
jgi:hypothetical protein